MTDAPLTAIIDSDKVSPEFAGAFQAKQSLCCASPSAKLPANHRTYGRGQGAIVGMFIKKKKKTHPCDSQHTLDVENNVLGSWVQ